MAQLIALEWDKSEIRLATGRRYGDSLQLDDLRSIAIPQDSEGDSSAQLTELLGELLGDQLTRGPALVNLQRGAVELRMMELPQVPADELPDMVRLQAVRHFTSLTDDWTLDFLPSTSVDSDTGRQSILAAAIHPDHIQQVQSACEAQQLTITQLALRSCSSASSWLQSTSDTTTSLLVDLLEAEADLTVIHDGQVALSRNVRLPQTSSAEQQDVGPDELALGDAVAQDEQPSSELNVPLLQSEIRRTIAAANSQLTDGSVEQLVLLGSDPALAETLGSGLELTVATFNFLDHVTFRGQAPASVERFTSLVGLIHDAALQQPPAFDFVSPRRKPHVASTREKTIRIGGWATIAVAVLIVLALFMYRNKSAQLAELQQIAAGLDAEIKSSTELNIRRQRIQDFRIRNIVWIDEILRLSESFPDSDTAIVRTMNFVNQATGYGRMSMDVNVRAAPEVSELENTLREVFTKVSGNGVKPNEDDPYYKFRSHQTLVVTPHALRETTEVEQAAPSASEDDDTPATTNED